ncbi:MAG: lytic transglycosylase domain-containing protein [Pyrinomonadaceae bacterium]
MLTRCNFKPRVLCLTRYLTSAITLPRAARLVVVSFVLLAMPSAAPADHLRLMDGTAVEVDEAWEDAQGIWYRRGGVTYSIDRSRVKKIERASELVKAVKDVAVVKAVKDDVTAPTTQPLETVWIHLIGGAKMEVDEANESADGVWYRRGNLSLFVERSRIDRIEREQLNAEKDEVAAETKVRRERRWSTGNGRIDALIKQNGARYDVDPYLIFCVMEQESHFNARALSPKGARGLMQLMPGTAARFGVRNAGDPAQNIMGGTRYLKELQGRFRGRVDLVLASYNAGEGAVMKYGHRVPPYRETRDYVRRIGARYGRGL